MDCKKIIKKLAFSAFWFIVAIILIALLALSVTALVLCFIGIVQLLNGIFDRGLFFFGLSIIIIGLLGIASLYYKKVIEFARKTIEKIQKSFDNADNKEAINAKNQ